MTTRAAMTNTPSAVHVIDTATVTPAMREARRALRLAGSVTLLFAMWLALGLIFCSVDPELSTQADHVLGSVTHTVSSWLLKSVGVMSFSIVLLIAQLGKLFLTSRVPQLSWGDCAVYLVLLCLSSTQLELALHAEMFGAPIGGEVGVIISEALSPLGLGFAQLLNCLLIFFLCFTYLRVLSHDDEEAEKAQKGGDYTVQDSPADARSDSWDEPHLNTIDSVYRDAQPVKSLNQHQQRAHTHILSQVGVQPPEFDEESKRFEAVDSFYDDLSNRGSPSDSDGLELEPIFQFDFDRHEPDEPRLTHEGSREIPQDRYTPPVKSPRGAREAQIPPDEIIQTERTTPFQGSQRHISSDRQTVGSLQNVSISVNMNREEREPARPLVDDPSAQRRSPVEKLSQEISPRISREMILKRIFDTQQLKVKLTQSESSVAMDYYVFAVAHVPRRPIYEITESLNLHIRRALGRTEPPVYVTVMEGPTVLDGRGTLGGQAVLNISWPKRGYGPVKSKVAITTIREIKQQGQLSLYIGELARGGRALLPLKESRLILITGGEKVPLDAGLNLLLINLIYQASPQKLRMLIVDQGETHEPIKSLSHLYSPVISNSDDISDLFTWLTAEQRRRRSALSRSGVNDFDGLQSAQLRKGGEKNQCDPRLVCVISNVGELNDRQQLLMSNLIEKLTQPQYANVGIHLIINNRGPLCDALHKARHAIDAQISLPAESLDEANLICSPGAEWLTANHDILFSAHNEVSRVNTWDLATESYLGILNVFTRAGQVNYIKPNTDFKRVVPLSSVTGKIPLMKDSPTPRAETAQRETGAHPMSAQI